MLNKIILIGNVGKDPDIRILNQDKKVAQVSLATSESYKDRNGEKQTKTQWHRLILWNSLAEIAEKYVKKGSLISIVGKIEYREYDDKQGVKHWATEIIVDELKLLSRSEATEKKEKPEDVEAAIRRGDYIQPGTPESANNEEQNDLPF